MNRPAKIIGLSVGLKSLQLAELAAQASGKSGARPAIQQLAEFPYPEGLSLNTPAELGAALAVFLKSRKFSTKDVILGLPARRLLTRRKEVPPASPAMAAATLRLQAESEFPAADADSFAIDYAGKTSVSESSAVLLIATAQSCIDQCVILAKAAGLRLRGITATGAALGRVTRTLPGGNGLIVSLAAGGAELVVQEGKNSTQIRHLAVTNAGTPESMGALVGEIRRTIAGLHQNGTPLTLALWDDAAGDSEAAGSLLAQRLGMAVSSPNVRSLALAADNSSNLNAYALAVAVGLAALAPAGLPIDFLHSRLIAPAERTNKRPILIASITGAVILLATIAGYTDLQIKQSKLDALTQQHKAHAGEINIAQTASDRLREVRKWTARKSRYAACLRDITKLFPQEGTNIWVTGLIVNPVQKDKKDVVSGKAVGEPQVRALKDKMLASKLFLNPTITRNDVNPPSVRGGPPEQSFSIEFIYKAPE